MNRILLKIFPIFLFCVSTNLAQSEIEKFFNPFMFQNQFYISNNPAFLHLDTSEDLLLISADYAGAQGDFKRFVDPGTITDYRLSFTGKKILDSLQLFKGSFTLSKEEYGDRQWLTGKYYSSGNPFQLGDSTSGRSRYNGININADYSRRIFSNLYAGIMLEYFVDEGLKTVSPRPVSLHREIDMTIGLGYGTDDFSIGSSYRIFDKYEEITYAQDEGSIYDETIIFKFNGYDNPWVFNKKSETRRSYNNGQAFNLGVDYLLNDNIKVSGTFILGNLVNDIKDNKNTPNPAGYWNKDFYNAAIHSNYTITKSICAGLKYKFASVESWSKHPDYNVILTESKSSSHNLELNAGYTASSKLKLGLGLFTQFGSMEYDDYYSVVNWNADGNLLGGKALASYSLSENINIGLAFEHGVYTLDKTDLTLTDPTIYFTRARLYDVYFYLTEYSYNNIELELDLLTENLGGFNLTGSYTGFTPENSELYKNTDRSIINIKLEYRIDVY